MSFTARTINRAMGASGHIQPRIAPITAPDVWQGPSELGLETIDVEVEAPQPSAPRDIAGPLRRGPPEPFERRVEPPSPARGSVASERVASERVASERVASTTSVTMPERVGGVASRGSEPGSPTPVRTASPAPSLELELEVSKVSSFTTSEPETTTRTTARELPSFRASRFEPRVDPFSSPAAPSARHVERAALLDEIDVEVEAPDAFVDATTGDLARPSATRSSSTSPLSRAEARVPNAPVEPSSASPSSSPSASVRARVSEAWATIDPVRPRRATDAKEGPIVRVEIGRVELRAPPGREAPPPTGIPKPDTFVSLKQYLRERGQS